MNVIARLEYELGYYDSAVHRFNHYTTRTPLSIPNPFARAGYDTRSIFKRILTGFNSEFSFSKTSCLTKAEEPSLSYYLPIAGGRIIGFRPSPRVLVLCEMQSVRSRIWTRVAVSISCDDNHYTTGTSRKKTFRSATERSRDVVYYEYWLDISKWKIMFEENNRFTHFRFCFDK